MREPAVPSAEPIAHKVTGNGYEETERDTVALSLKDEAGTVRGRQGCQQQGGQGAGWVNMAKKTELLINVVIHEQAKAADRPDPKWERSRAVPLKAWEHTVHRTSGEKAEPKLSASIQRNVVSLYILRQSGTPTVRKADGVWR